MPGSTTIAEAVAGEPSVTLSGSTDVAVRLSLEAAKAVFGQLLRNAVEHGATAVTIDAVRDQGALKVRVSDDGEGISAGNRDRVFEPFFTTRREAGGTGMGLQIVRSMLTAHGGTIRLVPADSGASFELTMPIAE